MITHKISTVSVFQTEEYQNFNFINGNRPLNQTKINRIIKEIESGNDMLKYYPVLVTIENDKLQILDGQHRFFISKKLKRPVYYMLTEKEQSIQEIAKVNSNVEKWKQLDFINCYIQQGNNNYVLLKRFIDLYGINIGTSLRLLSTGTPGAEGTNGDLADKFEKNLFVVKKWEEAVTLAEKCKLFEATGFWQDRAFIIAIFKIINANLIKFQDLVEVYTKFPGAIEKQHSYKQYIQALELLFNKNKQKRTIIF